MGNAGWSGKYSPLPQRRCHSETGHGDFGGKGGVIINRTDDVVLRHGVTFDETELPCADVGLIFAREGRQNGRRLW